MTATEIEQRFKKIEEQLAELRADRNARGQPDATKALKEDVTSPKRGAVIPPTSPNYWIEEIAGSFSSPKARAAFDEAMRYGREWRNSQKPKPRKRRVAVKK